MQQRQRGSVICLFERATGQFLDDNSNGIRAATG
jgi:hypothetical protein